jgi:GNAT superfamily N-acetyltransferase
VVKVRPATPDDLPALLAMGRALHAESPRYSRLSFSEAKIRALALQMTTGTLTTDAPGGALVAEKAGILIGMMAGYVFSPFFSEDKVATDYTLYVVPDERRRGKAAVALVRAFEAWAVEQGVTDIIPGTSTMIDAEGTARFYEKLGYEKYGYAMIKRVR